MGDKSVQKRKYIVEKAKTVFTKRGYRAVTMKDIVEACEISRGGLYLYFSSTKELFEAVLDDENKKRADIMSADRFDNVQPQDAMLMFLNEQKKEMLKKKDNLTVATYEYLFENRVSDSNNPMKKGFDENQNILLHIIQRGAEQGCMECKNPDETARSIALKLEGLRVGSQTVGITSGDIDRDIEYILGMLGMAHE